MPLNFLQISLTNRCNFSCWHCPMGKWHNSLTPRFPLDNQTLIPFLNHFVNPIEWVVELTGGEPTLYEGFDDLCRWLSSNGYYTLVKTNGSNYICKYKNIKICSAFHKLKEPPKYYDEYLIVDKIESSEKVAYCEEHNIPYRVIGFGTENPDNATHCFKYTGYINPAGHNCVCQAVPPIEDLQNDGIDYNRIDHRSFFYGKCCSYCKAAIDAWRFLPDFIKEIA